MKTLGTAVITLALILGLVGCGGGNGGNGDGSYTLIVDFTTGGTVTVDGVPLPGKAILTYDAGTVVSLGAVPDVGYRFTLWTGNVSTVADVNAANTAITMSGDHSITANFEPIPPLFTVISSTFFDYNGNGIQDSGEPPLEGIVLTYQPGNFSCVTSAEGKGVVSIPAGSYTLYVGNPGEFRYFLPSVSEVVKIEDGLSESITGNTTVAVPLGEGFLTLPYTKDTSFGVGEYFDYDPRDYQYLYWNGQTGRGPQRNHVGADFIVSDNGIRVVAPAPGRVIWLGKDPNGGYGIDVETSVGLVYGVFHIDPNPDLGAYSVLKRGQIIGTVDFPSAPHVHVDVKQYRSDGLYFMDTFNPSVSSPIEYRFVAQGETSPVDSAASPGYWTVRNNPQYP